MAKGDISLIVAIVILAFAVSSLTYIYISPKIISTLNVVTTTTSSPKACKAQSIPDAYQCNGNTRQQLFQQTNCNQIWVDQQYCQNGCSNGICLATTQITSSTTTATYSTTTITSSFSTVTTTTTIIPLPLPVKSNYLVGAYYWVSWNPNIVFSNYFDWKDSVFHPILGYYDSTNTTVVNYHIKWAVENGISFFAIQFYEPQLQAGFLNASFLPYIKFAFIAPHELSTNSENFDTQINYMSKYFSNSQYLKINSRPVVFIIINPYNVALTSDEESQLVTKMNNLKSYDQSNGLNPYLIGVYGIGDGSFNLTSQRISQEFDAITTYSWPSAGGSTSSYDAFVASFLSLTNSWKNGANAQGLSFVPVVSPGENDSLSYQHGTRDWLVAHSGSTPDKFKTMINGIKSYADSQNNKMLMIEAWNEFSEGSVIEPTQENGFGYLQSIKQSLTIS